MEPKPENVNKNDQTVRTYQDHFDVYTERTVDEPSGESKDWMDSFLQKLPPHSKILEFGSATGRDARYFASKGFDMTCTDVIPQAIEKLKNEGFKAEMFDFREEPKQEWMNAFDGFFANGVFVHATQETFEENLEYISQILRPKGIVGISFKIGSSEEISTDKMDAPRYFKYYSEAELREIISKHPFNILEVVYTEAGKWIRLTLENTKETL